jgi:hypothetical protein
MASEAQRFFLRRSQASHPEPNRDRATATSHLVTSLLGLRQYPRQLLRHAKTRESIMSDTDGIDIEDLIAAAQISGAGDPEQEIAALQDLLRVAWGLMTERQQVDFIESEEAQAVLDAEEDEPDEPGAE